MPLNTNALLHNRYVQKIVFLLLVVPIISLFHPVTVSDAADTGRAAVSDFEGVERVSDAEEQFQLGRKYFRGDGVARNMQKGLYWSEKAAQQGHLPAMMDYVVALVKLDRDNCAQAAATLREAAASHYSPAYFLLGNFYLSGRCGVTANHAEAVRLLTAAAMEGDSRAQNAIGAIYAQGKYVPKDLEESLFWSLLALQSGQKFEHNAADFCRRYLTPDQVGRVEQRVALFKPGVSRPQSLSLGGREFTIVPDPVQPGGKFGFTFRYKPIVPTFVDNKELEVETNYSIRQGGETLLQSATRTGKIYNNKESVLTNKNLKATTITGDYELAIIFDFKNGTKRLVKKKFSIR